MQDMNNPAIYWAIPVSDVSHKNPKRMDRIKRYCGFPDRDIRSCFYHIGTTNKPAVFKISNVLPLTEKYIEGIYVSQGIHLVLQDKQQIIEIRRKLSRILFDEKQFPNKYEQHITDIEKYLLAELDNTTVHEGGDDTQYESDNK
jgi:hypothetical protein